MWKYCDRLPGFNYFQIRLIDLAYTQISNSDSLPNINTLIDLKFRCSNLWFKDKMFEPYS